MFMRAPHERAGESLDVPRLEGTLVNDYIWHDVKDGVGVVEGRLGHAGNARERDACHECRQTASCDLCGRSAANARQKDGVNVRWVERIGEFRCDAHSHLPRDGGA